MCSNNVCRQASPILPMVLIYSLSVLFSYPLPLATIHPHVHKSSFASATTHTFSLCVCYYPLYIPRLSSPSFIVSRSTICRPRTHTAHTKIYAPCSCCTISLFYSPPGGVQRYASRSYEDQALRLRISTPSPATTSPTLYTCSPDSWMV